jgi:hypothetical protein
VGAHIFHPAVTARELPGMKLLTAKVLAGQVELLIGWCNYLAEQRQLPDSTCRKPPF